MSHVTAYIKNVKLSPKKLRFLLDDVRKLSPARALAHLLYTQKKGARILYKAISSAIHNAKSTLKISDDLLQFKLLTIEEGQKLKRYRSGGRGTMKPFVRKFSHIKIILTARDAEKVTIAAQKESTVTKKKVLKKPAVKKKTEIAKLEQNPIKAK